VLIVGGEDHRTGQAHDTDARFDCLEEWARERFPQIEHTDFRWSGQVMEPVDGLGFIGRNPGSENIFIATGDSGHGLTHGTIAGMLIRDLIDGADSPWKRLYDPSRKTLKAAREFARYNLNVARQYLGVVTAGESRSPESIPHGTGAVIRRGVEKIAVYCDEDGQRHEYSAVCPHLGCIVDWNETEKTWDCPCHGSRFSCDGKVINGPANSGLGPTEDDDKPVVMNPAPTPTGVQPV
jgi:Rieske Fe-S protein